MNHGLKKTPQRESKERTEKITACAYRLSNELGFGFLEWDDGKCSLMEVAGEGVCSEYRTRFWSNRKADVERKAQELARGSTGLQ